MGAASCGARQYAGTGAVEEGQPSVCVRASEKKYPFLYHKRKTILFMVGRKKSNNRARRREMAGSTMRYGRKKVPCKENLSRDHGKESTLYANDLGGVLSGKVAHVTHAAMVRRDAFA
jgi:hypothetical protein